jgi:hypothetical protein
VTVQRALIVGLVAAAALIGATGSAAKEFGPGDLRLCDTKHCVPIVDLDAVQLLSRFYYTGPQPPRAARPRWGARAFELRFSNGYVTGVVGGAALDRFLSFGVHAERFRSSAWYRMTPAAARELRRLANGLVPLRVTPALVSRSR